MYDGSGMTQCKQLFFCHSRAHTKDRRIFIYKSLKDLKAKDSCQKLEFFALTLAKNQLNSEVLRDLFETLKSKGFFDEKLQ